MLLMMNAKKSIKENMIVLRIHFWLFFTALEIGLRSQRLLKDTFKINAQKTTRLRIIHLYNRVLCPIELK